jgi:hypothetical protein
MGFSKRKLTQVLIFFTKQHTLQINRLSAH